MVCDSDTVRHFEQHLEQFAKWFKNEFKGIVPDLLSEEEATAQFVKHQKIPLKSIKINKLGYKDSVLLLGDSSHTMTPFRKHILGLFLSNRDCLMSIRFQIQASNFPGLVPKLFFNSKNALIGYLLTLKCVRRHGHEHGPRRRTGLF